MYAAEDPASYAHSSHSTADYNRCVLCGLCLPHCPTFQLTGYEADSPRGRITLIKGLLENKLSASPSLAKHLETCLHCGQCEAVCPSAVPFEDLINAAKKSLAEMQPSLMRPLPWWLKLLSASKIMQRTLARLLRLLQTTGMLKAMLFLRSYINPRWLMSLAALPNEAFTPPKSSPPADKPLKTPPQAALFTGCLAPALDDNTLRAAHCLLQAAGYEVHVPAAQACCGALHEHAGDAAAVKKTSAKNRQAFSSYNEVIGCASGCASSLLRHQEALGFKQRDIHDFLLKHAAQLKFRPLGGRVYLHTPCSMRGGSSSALTELLACVPSLEIAHLRAACCGAAGVNMLHHPEAAATLAKPMIDELAKHEAQLMLSPNMGCALHFRQQLFCHGLHAKVMHPVELLARQLDPNGGT